MSFAQSKLRISLFRAVGGPQTLENKADRVPKGASELLRGPRLNKSAVKCVVKLDLKFEISDGKIGEIWGDDFSI